VDAFLWIKQPGESDGTCNGGPKAGSWWNDIAVELARAATALGNLLPGTND
jgi:endoglucanase